MISGTQKRQKRLEIRTLENLFTKKSHFHMNFVVKVVLKVVLSTKKNNNSLKLRTKKFSSRNGFHLKLFKRSYQG